MYVDKSFKLHFWASSLSFVRASCIRLPLPLHSQSVCMFGLQGGHKGQIYINSNRRSFGEEWQKAPENLTLRFYIFVYNNPQRIFFIKISQNQI